MKEQISAFERERLQKAFASILRAQSGFNIEALQAVFFWWEKSRLKLFYHLGSQVTESEIEELRCMTSEIMSDFDIAIVDEVFSTNRPAEKDNMVAWIINSTSSNGEHVL